MKYSPTGVSFHTSDANLQRLYDAAEASLLGNIVQFPPTLKALVEGGGYPNVWIETQPMGGEIVCQVVTDLEGTIHEVVGLQPEIENPDTALTAGDRTWNFSLKPNQVVSITNDQPKIQRAVPFNYPYLEEPI